MKTFIENDLLIPLPSPSVSRNVSKNKAGGGLIIQPKSVQEPELKKETFNQMNNHIDEQILLEV